MTRPAPIIAGILAALLLLFGAYMGAYWALLDVAAPVRDPQWKLYTLPIYHWDTPPVYYFMLPANQLDRLIRPGLWKPPTAGPPTRGDK